jgi:hypothetical protein
LNPISSAEAFGFLALTDAKSELFALEASSGTLWLAPAREATPEAPKLPYGIHRLNHE